MLDSKGIREAIQEENWVKAFNSFAIRDIIDGVDSPLIVLEAKVYLTVEVSAVFVVIGVTGGLSCRIGELSMYCACLTSVFLRSLY